MTDIRTRLYNDPVVKFVVEFHFEPNEFFTEKMLTKTYFLNCLPDADDPLSYDGAEIFKCEGCKINWKKDDKGEEKKRKRHSSNLHKFTKKFNKLSICSHKILFHILASYSSFFDFFNPPSLPENIDDPNYADINVCKMIRTKLLKYFI